MSLPIQIILDEAEKLNSLSPSEYIELKATLHAVYNRQFICSDCLVQYDGRADKDRMLERVRAMKGCEKLLPVATHHIKENGLDIGFKSCIGNFFSPSAMYWIESFTAFKNGTMPFEGGYMDQPNKVVEVMSVIEKEKLKQEKMRMDLVKAKNRNMAR